MLIDLEAVSSPQSYRSRICVVGGGISGLTLARDVMKTKWPIHLLESGGLRDEVRATQLNRCEHAGSVHRGASEGRFRVFGGTSSRWGGQILPLAPDVFQPMSGSGLPVWPIRATELEGYTEAIEQILGVNNRPYSSRLLHSFGEDTPFRSSDVGLRFSKWAPHQRRNLARTIGAECIASADTCVFVHATVTQLITYESGGAIQTALVRTNCGKVHKFQADLFVLCTGTIEVSRLLLASNDRCKPGLGNDHDQVGRYFHDHISVLAGELPTATRRSVRKYFTPRFISGTIHTPKLEASSSLRFRDGLLSTVAHFPIEEPEGSGLKLVRSVLAKVQSGTFDRRVAKDLVRVSGQSIELSSLLWSAYLKRKRPIFQNARVTLQIDCEQRPQAESRIYLSDKLDHFGSRLPVLRWLVAEEERKSVQAYARIIQSLFRDNGFGDIQWLDGFFSQDRSWLALVSDSLHMMGGTRMGSNPAHSVVDENLKVHGLSNLYISSCSCFPSGGSSNPTLTLMALTLRLSNTLINKQGHVTETSFRQARAMPAAAGG